MPENATITSFFSFTAGNKARASEVNTNFSNFRGHLIPIDPNTTTATDLTYDLGSTEYRWRNIYGAELFIGETTNSSNIYFTNGGLYFDVSGTTRAVIDSGGISDSYLDISTSNSISRDVLQGSDFTSTGSTNPSITTLTETTIATLSIVTDGRPIEFSYEATSVRGTIFLTTGASTTWLLRIKGAGSTLAQNAVSLPEALNATASTQDFYLPATGKVVDLAPGSTTKVYEVTADINASTSGGRQFNFGSIKLLARKI